MATDSQPFGRTDAENGYSITTLQSAEFVGVIACRRSWHSAVVVSWFGWYLWTKEGGSRGQRQSQRIATWMRYFAQFSRTCSRKLGPHSSKTTPDHTARRTMNVLNANNANVSSWPARSPDMSPLEHVWDLLVKELNKSKTRFIASTRLGMAAHSTPSHSRSDVLRSPSSDSLF